MYKGMKVLDVHSHIHDRSQPRRHAIPFLATLLGSPVPLASPIGPGKHYDAPGNRDEDFKAVAAAHAKYLDERNIDTQIIDAHPHRIYGWMEPHRFKSWISYSNDMVFKICQAEPDHFVGACNLPQMVHEKDTTHCLEELERCVHEYGFVATYVSPDITGRRDTPGMNEPYWYPLYAKCQELGIPIIVHGTDGLDRRYRSLRTQYYQLTFVTEQYITLALLRQNDQFERFPGLKIIICHCGGALDRHINDPWLCKDKTDHSANLFYDTCAYDLDFLATAIKQRGASQFVFGTEAPGGGVQNRPGTTRSADDLVPMFAEHPTLSFLSEQDRQDIMHNRPAKMFPGLANAAAQNAKAKVRAY